MSYLPPDEKLFKILCETHARYARCIDDLGGKGWPDFFDADCFYVVTTAENYQFGLEACLIYADSQGMLKDRISALNEANIYEQHVYRHIYGQPLILSREGDLVYSETGFLVARIMRTGETTLFATGRYIDCHRITPDSLLIRERKVVCDSSAIDTLLALPL